MRLGDADQEPMRPVDKPLTTGRKAVGRGAEVKGEPAGQEDVRAGDSNPHVRGHRDLNCAGVVVAGGVPGTVTPLSRTDTLAPSRPVSPRPSASQQVP
jgi:hypothetical protein